MGYRIHLAQMSKEKFNELSKMTKKEFNLKYLKDDDDWIGVYDLAETRLYEFGKYVEWTAEEKEIYGEDVFKDKELAERYEEHDFYKINQDGLLSIIGWYHGQISDYFQELEKASNDLTGMRDKYEKNENFIKNYFRSKSNEWGNNFNLTPYDLKREDTLISSWLYEYGIFELVKIYKEFDFENNVAIIYGY